MSASSLCWELDPAAGRIRIDPAQLEQVILNLAINARDAMPDGGRLHIAVSAIDLDGAECGALGVSPGRYVTISASDNGTGMDAATRLRCFEPLFTTKGPSHGTGLGLAAVKGVVRDSGGAVRVDSTPGEGTTFLVYLPAVGDGEAVDSDDTEPTVGPGRSGARPISPDARTVLVAEDDEPLRRLMSQVLTRDGYRVLEASDGCEARESGRGLVGHDRRHDHRHRHAGHERLGRGYHPADHPADDACHVRLRRPGGLGRGDRATRSQLVAGQAVQAEPADVAGARSPRG